MHPRFGALEVVMVGIGLLALVLHKQSITKEKDMHAARVYARRVFESRMPYV
tara:strand:+ start:808 stop:963 length:156 start_codon:yes stop_codon:yes gene_type:complete